MARVKLTKAAGVLPWLGRGVAGEISDMVAVWVVVRSEGREGKKSKLELAR